MKLRADRNPFRHLRLILLWGCTCASVLLAGGCRQRAFNELYAESLAREIREVEDLVYEFEAENRAMEYEIDDLRRVNAQLQLRLQQAQVAGGTDSSSGAMRPGTGIGRKSLLEGVVPLDGRSEEGRTPNPSATPKSPPRMQLPAANDKGRADVRESSDLEVPEIVIPKKAPPTAPNGPVLGRPTTPSVAPIEPPRSDAGEPSVGIIPKPSGTEGITEGMPSGPASSGSVLPETTSKDEIGLPRISIPGNPGSPVIDPAGIQPSELLPTDNAKPIPSGSNQPVKTREPLLRPAPQGLPEDISEAVLRERRIYTPPSPEVLLASATATSKPESVSAKDRNVRGIEFHPTLCRGHNFDGLPGDDGMALVLLTLNASQQFVPGEGTLTIVAEEPSSDGAVNRIGRWEIQPAQLRDWLEPVGTAQGFHIQLPWQDRKPEGLLVDVYVRLVLPDGTKMVNRKTIHLRKPNSMPSTWTPR